MSESPSFTSPRAAFTSSRAAAGGRPFVVVAVFALLAACSPTPEETTGAATGEARAPQPATPVEATDAGDLDSADLYFPGDDGRLYLHRQTLPVSTTDDERISAMVRALIEGPAGSSDGTLISPLPPGTLLAGVYRVDERTAALDLRSAEGAPAQLPVSGSKYELATVYSLVNTVVLGTDDVDRVVLLWNGRQPETFSGHLDLSRPLGADPGLIAPSSP